MAARKPTAKKRATKRRSTASKARRRPVARKPRRGGLGRRAAVGLGTFAARQSARHIEVRRSRRDAAILRAAHAGCSKCGGAGVIYKRAKDGSYAGSKTCTAKPTTMRVSKIRVAVESRVGVDKTSGLCGWRCPCGKHQKPRYRTSKEATAALRAHEKKRHGGTTVGGAWYAQIPANTAPTPTKKEVAMPSKTNTNSGMTDQQWEKQNGSLHPDTARRRGLCWHCSGKGANYSAFGGEHITTVCPECIGTGRAKTAATAA